MQLNINKLMLFQYFALITHTKVTDSYLPEIHCYPRDSLISRFLSHDEIQKKSTCVRFILYLSKLV